MSILKIKEIIVVEGKNDTNVLQSYLDCDTIETHGTYLSKEILAMIAAAKEKRGIIIFTDPDSPGERIRHTINENIPGCKNAFIERAKAHTSKKVGVEHASKEDIIESLQHLMTYSNVDETLSFADYIDLGFNGQNNSAWLREQIGRKLFIGKPNAKTLYKRLNMLQLTKADIEKMIKEIT